MAAPTVTLYTQQGCADSRRTRRLLRAQGVPFVERDVGRDAEAAAALARTGVFATRLLVVGERTIFGFRPAAIAAALEEAGLWEPEASHGSR